MMKKAAAPDHVMGTAPVSRLLLRNTLPLIFVSVLTAAGSLTHVWYAFILAEVLSAPLCAFLMHRVQKDILQNLT